MLNLSRLPLKRLDHRIARRTKARVIVTLKAGVDPQGKAIEGALASLGIANIASVRQGKVFDIEVGADGTNAQALPEGGMRQAARQHGGGVRRFTPSR